MLSNDFWVWKKDPSNAVRVSAFGVWDAAEDFKERSGDDTPEDIFVQFSGNVYRVNVRPQKGWISSLVDKTG